jgi:mevalonate kinase
VKTITYSAPGKVILAGEHAVVYGKPALISATNLRLHFILSPSDCVPEEEFISVAREAAITYLKKNNVEFEEKPFSYIVESTVPRGAHMGSSAALSVAAAGAILDYYAGHEFSKEVINSVAYAIEKFFHGNPSGGDNSTCCYGGLIYFRKEFEFLKQISSLNFKIPKIIEDHIYLIDSGTPIENTGVMVAKVGKLYNEKPKETEQIMNQIEKVVKRMVVSVVKEDTEMFKSSIEENEKCLEQIGVVSPKAQKMIEDMKEFGVGKVTGGGGYEDGSGHLIFFADKPTDFERYLAKKKVNFIKFKQDGAGVINES